MNEDNDRRQLIEADNSSRLSDQPQPPKYTSQIAALFIIVNVTVGAGLLAMPSAMQASGLVTSLIMQAIFLLAVIVTCIMSTELTVKTGANSYHRVMEAHCHRYVYQFSQIALVLIVFGTAIAYIVIIGDQFDRVFASLYGPTFCYTWYLNRRFIMSATTVFVLKPLCSARTVDFLKYGSFVGVASLGFVIYVVVSEFIKQGRVAKDVNYWPAHWTDLGSILPVLCLAYQCHLSWVPTVATVRKEEKYTSYLTITAAMTITACVYTLVCVLAVLTFGSSILDDLTESYPGKTWPIITTVAIVAFKAMVTLPPAFLPVRLSLIDILSSQSPRFANLSERTQRMGITFVTLSGALLLALSVPNILVAVDLLGCLAVVFIFTLPCLAYLHLIKENRLRKQELAGLDTTVPNYTLKDRMKQTVSYLLIVTGVIMTVLVLKKSLDKVLSSNSGPPICHL